MHKKKILRLSRDPSEWVYYKEPNGYSWSPEPGWWRITGSYRDVSYGMGNGTFLILTRPDWASMLHVRVEHCRPANTVKDFRELEETISRLERYINDDYRKT